MAERLESLVVSIEADTTRLRGGLGEATRLGRSFGSAITSAFEDAAINGRKLSDVVRGLALDFSRSALRDALSPLKSTFGGLLGSAIGNVNTGSGGLAGLLPFAEGGVINTPVAFPLARGGRGVAGEAGPEAILPLARGPDGKLGVRTGSGPQRPITINFNVTASDADSFRRSQAQLSAMLARAAERGTRNL